MGWYNDKADAADITRHIGAEVPIKDDKGNHLITVIDDALMARFRTAIARYEHLIEYAAARHDTLGKETTEDLYQIGVDELWCAIVEDWDRCDPLDRNFEAWFKTRLFRRMIDHVALYKPRRTPKSMVEEKPVTVRLRRHKHLDIDTFPMEGVTKVMNICQGDRDYAEGTHFEFIPDPASLSIRWLTEDQPSPTALYYVEGVQETTITIAPSAGRRDPRLEVADTLWEQFTPSNATPGGLPVAAHNQTPEDRFLQEEVYQVVDVLRNRLIPMMDTECTALLAAMTRNTMNEGAGTVQHRLMKYLGWSKKKLTEVNEKLTKVVQGVITDLRSEGYEVTDLARNFYMRNA